MLRRPTALVSALALWWAAPATATVGDDCSDPIAITLPADGWPFVDANTTCGRGDDYRETCLGAHDDGEDIICRLELTEALNLRLSVAGAELAGIVIDTACPPSQQCLSLELDRGDWPPRLDIELEAGTYYVMIDGQTPPACNDFVLTIEQLPPLAAGDSCSIPLIVRLPTDLPYADISQHTCGRWDFYSDFETCIGEYDGGEETIYSLEVSQPIDVEFELDPKGQAFAAIVLDDGCPPAGAACLAHQENQTGEPLRLECLHLEPGTYSLMVDRWPVAALGECLPDFDLTISQCELRLGACCLDQDCLGTLSAAACGALGGTWYEGFECGEFACPIQLPELPESCPTAWAVSELPFSARLTSYAAEPDGPAGSCNAPGTTVMQNDVWFTYTPPSSRELTVDAVYYLYNGMTVAYHGADCDHLVELHCLDSQSAVPDSDSITFQVAGGVTYWFQLGDWGLNPGGGDTLLSLRAAADLRPGDVNCDGLVDFGDINPFVLLLSNPALWKDRYPGCPFLNGDVNQDGEVNMGDINPFVTLLTGR